MSPSERLIDGPFAKRLVIVSSLVPGLLLVVDAFRGQLGVNDVNFAIRTTGIVGLVFIVLALAITPLRTLTGWRTLIAPRRNFGVIGFCYLAAHFLIFFWFDRQASVVSTFDEIVKRRYLWFGTGALLLMVPLAMTSTDAMVARLGAVRWKTLQRLAYLVAIGAVVHYYLLVKSDVRQPLAFAGAVGLLFGFRGVRHYTTLRAAAHTHIGTQARTRGGQAGVDGTQRPRKRGSWSGDLVVARIFRETHDVKTFRLVSPDGGPLPFSHTAGQYLNLALTIDGKRVNRSYTIASSPTVNAYCEISVKLAVNGYGSRHLHEGWREGDRVKVSAPAGSFVFAGHEADRVVLLAGGIGVTPMMSIVRSLTDRGWSGSIYFVLATKTLADVTFADELKYLASRFPNLHLLVVLSNEPEPSAWRGARGHLTPELLTHFTGPLTAGPVLLCGPPPMMTAMRAMLVDMGVADSEILQEAFVSRPAIEPSTEPAAKTMNGESVARPFVAGETATITFARSDRMTEVTGEQTLLEAAEECGVDIPFECRSGICGQCRTRVVRGRVFMEVEDALTARDRSQGIVLACQARPASDLIVEF